MRAGAPEAGRRSGACGYLRIGPLQRYRSFTCANPHSYSRTVPIPHDFLSRSLSTAMDDERLASIYLDYASGSHLLHTLPWKRYTQIPNSNMIRPCFRIGQPVGASNHQPHFPATLMARRAAACKILVIPPIFPYGGDRHVRGSHQTPVALSVLQSDDHNTPRFLIMEVLLQKALDGMTTVRA